MLAGCLSADESICSPSDRGARIGRYLSITSANTLVEIDLQVVIYFFYTFDGY